MRNLKKILALVLALMMVLSVMVTASAASPLDKFEDAESINPDYKQAVEVMVAAGVFSGTDNGFEPGLELTREQAATLITVVATGGKIGAYKAKCETNFDDVPATSWASGFITFCYDNGLILGTSATEYSPALELSYEQYAAMLLRVLKIDCSTDGKWYVPVRNNAKTAGLVDGLDEDFVWTDPVTREEAAQMTFNALTYRTTTSTTGKYVVAVSEEIDTKATDYAQNVKLIEEAAENPFDTRADALVYMTALKLELGADYVIKEQENPGSYLLLKNFGISQTAGTDLYGRSATVYTIPAAKEGEKPTYLRYPNSKAVKTYNGKVTADTIAEDLEGYYVFGKDGETKYNVEGDYVPKTSWAAVSYYVDGSKTTSTGTATLAEALADLTADNTTVSFYVNKYKAITNIVVVKEHASTIIAVETDDDDVTTVTLDDKATYVTDAYTEEDIGTIVLYTKDKNGVNGMKTAETVTGTLTKYTSKGAYTFGGTVYNMSAAVISGTKAAIEGTVGKTDAYSVALNTAGCIVGVVGVKTPEFVLPTDYVVVIGTEIKYEVEAVEADTFAGEENTTELTLSARVKVLHVDGTFAIYDLPVIKAPATVPAYGLTKDHYYTVINDEYVELLTKEEAAKVTEKVTEITDVTLDAPVYAYTSVDGVISLYEMPEIAGNETEDGVVIGCTDGKAVAKNAVAINAYGDYPVLVNADTKIVYNYKDGDEVVTAVVSGLSNTNGLDAECWGMIIGVDATEKKDGSFAQTYTAQIIYVPDAPVDALPVPNPVVYVSGEYSDTGLQINTDSGKVNLYAYVAYAADGSELELLWIAKELTAGLYEYDAATGLIDGSKKASASYSGTYNAINDSVVTVDGTYLIVDDNTVVVEVGGNLKNGATVEVFVEVAALGGNDNLITVIYVVE